MGLRRGARDGQEVRVSSLLFLRPPLLPSDLVGVGRLLGGLCRLPVATLSVLGEEED